MSEDSARILIADDQPDLLRMLELYLTRRGFAVTAVETTEAAWARFQADPQALDVAVLDATMPGLSMPELAVRMLRANPALHVLGASGYPVDMAAVEAAAPGRVAFLHKPFTPDALVAAVRSLLGAKKEDL